MTLYNVSNLALTDLEEIWDYFAIELGDIALAERMNKDFFAAFRSL